MLDVLATAGSHAQIRPDASLHFYQASVGVFSILILTGVVGELRDMRSHLAENGGSMSGTLKARLAGNVVLLIIAMVGGFLSVSVLIDPPAQKFEQLAVVFSFAVTVIGIPLLTLGSLGEHAPGELKRLTQALLLALLFLVVGASLYLIATALDEDPATYTHHVYGTCAAGACGLNERAEPSVEAESMGQLRDGDEVEVVCQVKGGVAVIPSGRRSRIWDKLSNGVYVPDLLIDTPPVGSEIPACE